MRVGWSEIATGQGEGVGSGGVAGRIEGGAYERIPWEGPRYVMRGARKE